MYVFSASQPYSGMINARSAAVPEEQQVAGTQVARRIDGFPAVYYGIALGAHPAHLYAVVDEAVVYETAAIEAVRALIRRDIGFSLLSHSRGNKSVHTAGSGGNIAASARLGGAFGLSAGVGRLGSTYAFIPDPGRGADLRRFRRLCRRRGLGLRRRRRGWIHLGPCIV